MIGETNLKELIKKMEPLLNDGEYVFLSVEENHPILSEATLSTFKEQEGTTIIVKREVADSYDFSYDFVASWITLSIHSALEAVGLTAAFSNELAKNDISCNVVAGFYHDHIFVDRDKALKAVEVLKAMQ